MALLLSYTKSGTEQARVTWWVQLSLSWEISFFLVAICILSQFGRCRNSSTAIHLPFRT